MNLIEFGKRVAIVRETVLKMSQADLAKELETYQALVSRLENGVGGSIILVFDLINLLKKKKLSAHMLFREPFDVNLLSKDIKSPNEELTETLDIKKDKIQNNKKDRK